MLSVIMLSVIVLNVKALWIIKLRLKTTQGQQARTKDRGTKKRHGYGRGGGEFRGRRLCFSGL